MNVAFVGCHSAFADLTAATAVKTLTNDASDRAIAIECDGVVFDLDGGLVDSAACVERHWTQWLARQRLDPRDVIERI